MLEPGWGLAYAPSPRDFAGRGERGGMKFAFFDRIRHRNADSETKAQPPVAEQPTVVQIDASALSRVFSAPVWVRDLGLLAWFLVGVAVLFVGLTWRRCPGTRRRGRSSY